MFNAEKVKDDIVQWIRGYFDKNGRDCSAVVGISGGKDSSIVAALCVQALGKDRVYGVLMPQGIQHDIDVSRDLVAYLGIKHCVINIKDQVESLLDSVKNEGLEPNRQAAINTAPRLRMTILYAVSAIVNGRVANTSNLSEAWIGYSTKFGDGAGDFSPLSHLTVTELKALGREIGLPLKFVDKIPEDGLSGKTDEDNFGFTYNVLDRYIREGVCEEKSIREKIDRLHQINLHKINPMPGYNPA